MRFFSGALLVLAFAAPASGGVTPGEYCVSGLGNDDDDTTDGWLTVVTPGGAITDLTPQLTTALVDPWDCAIDPTNGDIILVDEGDDGAGLDGSIQRITWDGTTATQTILHNGDPLVNPRGLAVGQDGTIYVGDMGEKVDDNAADGAVYYLPPAGTLQTLVAVGGVVDPTDVDVDPKPFPATGPSPGVNLVILEGRGGAFKRVPLGGGTLVTMPSAMGGNDWQSFEVGPYGNYFASRDGDDVERYDRLTGFNQPIASGGNLNDPDGLTVDYYTGDLVIADGDRGMVNVPPNAYLGGAPGQTIVAALGNFPDDDPAGIGFSPPLASASPSTQFGMPTRRAPDPGAAMLPHGAATATSNGDVEQRTDLYIEVTDVSSPLMIRIFDANVRDGYDQGTSGTQAVYTLTDPNRNVVTTYTVVGNGRVDLDQRIATLNSGNTLTIRGPGIDLSGLAPGLYQLTVSVPTGGDFNAFGVWVEDFTTYTYGSVYGALNAFTGPAPDVTPLDTARIYPYFDRGCEYTASNFDLDVNSRPASLTVTSRLGVNVPLTGSNNNTHAEDLVDPTAFLGASSNVQLEYGLHSMASVLSPNYVENNIVTMRFPDFTGWVDDGTVFPPIPVPPGNPAANPTPALTWSPGPAILPPAPPPGTGPNRFLRQYMPRYDEAPGPLGAAATPYAPYLMHSATPLGNDPPTAPVPPNAPAYYAVQVTLVNPDPVNALTTPTVLMQVPAPTQYVELGFAGGRWVVNGPATVSGGVGGNVTTCGTAPCSGLIWASWTSIPPASEATVSYAVAVYPTFAGELLYLTGGPAVRGGGATPAPSPVPAAGTQAYFVPAWASGSFPRWESLGPICELTVREGTITPVAVELARFEAHADDAEVRVEWETASEFENLGFHLYRRLEGESDYTRITPSLVLGQGTSDFSASYAVRDQGVPNGVRAEYLLEDVEFDGTATRHGPVAATPAADASPPPTQADVWLTLRGGAAGDMSPAGPSSPGGEPASDAGNGNETADEGSFRVIERGSSHVLVEIVVPAVTLVPTSLAGQPQLMVQAAGYDSTLEPGWPELPARTWWIEDAPPGQPSLTLLERSGSARSLATPVLPVAGAELDGSHALPVREPDPEAYASDVPYPSEPAVIAGRSSAEGGSQVVALRVQPARYRAASGGLETDEHLVLRLDFGAASGAAEAASAPGATSPSLAAAAARGVKIATRGPGLTRVEAEALLAAGLDPGADPRELRLLRQDHEVAARIVGEEDGRLDPGDALLFWSAGFADRYTDQEVYFLIPAGEPGLRVGDASAAPVGPEVPAGADATAIAEEQSIYLPGVRNGEGDNYVGPYVFDSPVEIRVATPAARSEDATLKVRLRGGTTYAHVPDDHHFVVRLGETDLLDARFDGSEFFEGSVMVPGFLLDGEEQTLRIVPQFDSGAPFDLVYVDRVEIGYRRDLVLRPEDAGTLRFVAEHDGVHVVSGLPVPVARVWDVTDPDQPLRLSEVEVAGSDARFTAHAGRSYVLVAAATAPASLTENSPSAHAEAGAADWLAIAHGDLIDALAPLVAQREAQGLRGAVVDVEDVYDEMAGGRFSPPAIRDFVRRVRATWDPAPRYLLLVGDATYDYRDFLGGQAENLVPTMLVDTAFVESASDSYFGAPLDGEAPALSVGRLPVRDADELAALVTKLVQYEQQADADPTAAWRSRMLLVADDGAGGGNPGEAAAFEAGAESFAVRAPGGFDVRSVLLSELPEAGQGESAKATIRAALGDGASFAFYSGHGGARLWADELIFGADEFETLANEHWPFFLVLNCLNGFFDAPNEESFAEAALRAPDRGAVAFVSSTTVSALAGQDALADALAERLLRGNVRRVGDVFGQALQGIAGAEGSEDVVRAFVLIGDPATRLALPEVPVANAGEDRLADSHGAAQLDGSGSAGPEGAVLGFDWRVVEAPEGADPVLTGAETATPWLWAHRAGRYRVELVVDDGHFQSAPDTVTVDVPPPAALRCGETTPDPHDSAGFGPDLLYFFLPALLARLLLRRPRRERSCRF